tara:strand:+ start:1545 stop:1745 length:201 start_codon:yes stop_codon:yes gene_type:complete
MLIYGNTPSDIMKMFARRYKKIVGVIALIVVMLLLIGCSGPNSELKVLDQFWDKLGGKTNSSQEVE